jgi:hypothetical protein
MKSIPIVLGGIAAMAFPLGAWARPITYPGGTNVMVGTSPQMDMVHIDHTLNRNWAVGWSSSYDLALSVATHGPQVTRGWRWNYPDSQANVYLTGGVGAAVIDDDAKASAWSGVTADWENRRWFTQIGTGAQTIADGPDRLRSQARLGIAPYVAEAGALHTWLMVQADHLPGEEETWRLTPLIRQFWRDTLWEAGVDTRGGVLLSIMKTF